MRIKLDQIYDQVLNKNFDLEKNLKSIEDENLNIIGLTERENCIIRESFSAVVEVNQKNLDVNL